MSRKRIAIERPQFSRDGLPWVTWNYRSDAGGRKSRTGRLLVTGGAGAAADFKVG